MTCVAEVLKQARLAIPVGEARLLLGHVLRRPPAWLMAHDDYIPKMGDLHSFEDMVARRNAGEPIAYLVGHREFFGREFITNSDVLIPRPETELLVEAALTQIDLACNANGRQKIRVLDLGTGSGCIAVTLALERPQLDVFAVDVSSLALAVASLNAKQLGANIHFLKSDWFAALSDEAFDFIVANPPYIAANDRHLGQGDLRFEPLNALSCGEHGLEALRRITVDAPCHLAEQGELWLEHGYDQAEAVYELFSISGFAVALQHQDIAGITRVTGGRIGARTNENGHP